MSDPQSASDRLGAALAAIPQTALTLKSWQSDIFAAARAAHPELQRLAKVLTLMPPRTRRVFEALADVTVPDGWSVEYKDGPLGIVLRRNEDGYVDMVMPGTDGTGRWYIGTDFGNNAQCNGTMGADAQEALDWLIGHAP